MSLTYARHLLALVAQGDSISTLLRGHALQCCRYDAAHCLHSSCWEIDVTMYPLVSTSELTTVWLEARNTSVDSDVESKLQGYV